jgi:hypothetical protein
MDFDAINDSPKRESGVEKAPFQFCKCKAAKNSRLDHHLLTKITAALFSSKEHLKSREEKVSRRAFSENISQIFPFHIRVRAVSCSIKSSLAVLLPRCRATENVLNRPDASVIISGVQTGSSSSSSTAVTTSVAPAFRLSTRRRFLDLVPMRGKGEVLQISRQCRGRHWKPMRSRGRHSNR